MDDVMIYLWFALLVIGLIQIFFLLRKGSFWLNDQKIGKSFDEGQQRTTQFIREEIQQNRKEFSSNTNDLREEIQLGQKRLTDSLIQTVGTLHELQSKQLDTFSLNLNRSMDGTERHLLEMRSVVEKKLEAIQEDTSKKLEQMRLTVEEKLQGTLEKKLGESFLLVSQRLEQVHRGLGEMQQLANGVGDLKKVLSNVKTRGLWGEIQLGNLLEQILSPSQYAANVNTKGTGSERVEFAIRLPGNSDKEGHEIWLPIDSKFPQEDYLRMIDAYETLDLPGIELASKQLEIRIKQSAKEISEKYIGPPHTTDFAILFLPIEGLYAEVVRKPGLLEVLQKDYRIVIAGPTTFAALLNSLQIGFKTLAIQKRSSEVWNVLANVKTEFSKFGDVIDKVQKKLQEASNVVEDASKRTRVLEKKLKNVQQLPENVGSSIPDTDLDGHE